MIYISTFLYACHIYLKENIYFENDNRKRGSGDNECSSFSGDALKGTEMDGGWNLKVSSIQSAPEDTLSRAGTRSLHRPRPAPWASRQCRDKLPTLRHPPQTPAKSASGPLPRRPRRSHSFTPPSLPDARLRRARQRAQCTAKPTGGTISHAFSKQ